LIGGNRAVVPTYYSVYNDIKWWFFLAHYYILESLLPFVT
jgi:hypothetical protein